MFTESPRADFLFDPARAGGGEAARGDVGESASGDAGAKPSGDCGMRASGDAGAACEDVAMDESEGTSLLHALFMLPTHPPAHAG